MSVNNVVARGTQLFYYEDSYFMELGTEPRGREPQSSQHKTGGCK